MTLVFQSFTIFANAEAVKLTNFFNIFMFNWVQIDRIAITVLVGDLPAWWEGRNENAWQLGQ